MGYSLLGTLLDTTGEKVKNRVDQSNQMDQEMRATQTQALINSIMATDENGNPKLSPAEAEEAWGRIEKLHSHNKGAKDILAKARDVTSKIFGFGGKANAAMAKRAGDQTVDALQQSGQQPSQQPENDPQGGINATPYTPPPPQRNQPVQQTAAAATLPAPPQRSIASLIQKGAPNPAAMDIAKDKRTQATKIAEIDATGRNRIAEIEATARGRGDKKLGTITAPDGAVSIIFQSAFPDPITGKPVVFLTDTGGKSRIFAGRLSPGTHLTVAEALAMQEATKDTDNPFKVLDESGKPFDLTKIPNPQGQQLIAAEGGIGTPDRYRLGTQAQRIYTADNVVKATPSLEQTNPAAAVPLGAARVGTASTQEQPNIDANGNLVEVTTHSSSTPVTPAPAAPAVPGQPIPPSTRTVAPPTSQNGVRTIPGVLPAAERDKQLQVARPVRAAAVQLFGTEDNPNIESLESFAKLADNPDSRRRVGAAARMIINDLSAADKGGGVGAQVLGNGASLNGGDLWTALKNTVGLTNWISTSQVKATEQALSNLTPQESRLLNQIMAAYGTVVGLRSLTKGGAYKFSVDSMERELPIPGIADVNNSTIYYNKLSKIANEIVEGGKGVSDSIMPEKSWFQRSADRLNALGQGKKPPAAGDLKSPPNRSTTPGSVNYTYKGQVYSFPNQKALDSFKSDMGVK